MVMSYMKFYDFMVMSYMKEPTYVLQSAITFASRIGYMST